jgi:hypothetical protein
MELLLHQESLGHCTFLVFHIMPQGILGAWYMTHWALSYQLNHTLNHEEHVYSLQWEAHIIFTIQYRFKTIQGNLNTLG